MTPFLSVLMPTYRGERYLAEALESIAGQGAPDVECIVVDDGSDDRTLAIAHSFEDRLAMRFVEGPRAGNWVASTNAALGAARGTWCSLLHQDDGWAPGRIARLRQLVARHTEATLLLHSVELRDSSSAELGAWRCPLPTSGPIDPDALVAHLLVQNFVAIPAPTFLRREALAVGGLDPSLWYTADWDFWLALARRGPAVYVDEPLAFFRIHGESQTIARSGDANDFRIQMTTVLERHRAACPADVRDAVERASRLSIEANVALASLAHGRIPAFAPLAHALRASDRESLGRFARDARFVERVAARLRAAARGRLRR